MLAYPHLIELVHGLLNDFRVICQDASLEVTSTLSLHTDSCTCEICAADIYLFTIKDQYLEMNTRTKHSLQTVIKYRILVKVLSEVWTRFLCMNQPYLHTTPNELGNECQKRLFLLAHFHIQVFYVSGTNPKHVLHGLHP